MSPRERRAPEVVRESKKDCRMGTSRVGRGGSANLTEDWHSMGVMGHIQHSPLYLSVT